jgi:hypothetical protein
MNNLLYIQWSIEAFIKVILPLAVYLITISIAYKAGQQKILDAFDKHAKRKREREKRWREFEDEEVD